MGSCMKNALKTLVTEGLTEIEVELEFEAGPTGGMKSKIKGKTTGEHAWNFAEALWACLFGSGPGGPISP